MTKGSNDIILQDIWKTHTEVQEQMLQLRSAPVRVVPESARIIGEKLFIHVDENDKTGIFLETIEKIFDINSNDIDVKNGYFYADIDQAKNITIKQKMELSERASACFFEFIPNPIIDGYIKIMESPSGSFNELENLLREKFPSISIKRDKDNRILYFSQEYQTIEQAVMLKDMIQSELNNLDSNIIESGLYDIPRNKEKYILSIDSLAKKKSQIAAITEIRGADFNINGNHLGKLYYVNFPEIRLDISGDNFEENKLLFEAKNVDSIEPNLVGDIEKIYRLNSAFNNIINSKDLQNPRLKDFIFDSSKAKPIDFTSIDLKKELHCEDFEDFKSHILNKKVNDSQIDAIKKTLLAEDLALIQGPPGTGKSTAIAEIIWQHIRKNPQERILLTSETNLAVDNAIDRIVNCKHNLVKPIRFGGEEKLENEGRQFSIETMKRWVENGVIDFDPEEMIDDEENLPQKLILQNWISNIERRIEQSELNDTIDELWRNTLSNPSKSIREAFYNSYIKNCNVIGATCSSIGEKNIRGNPTGFFRNFCEIFGTVDNRINKEGKEYSVYNGDLKFTTVIQDESSKATPAELSLPLIYGNKNIIIGDHRQLPPLLDRESFMLSFDFLLDRTDNEEEIKKIKRLRNYVSRDFAKLEISHFELLFKGIDDSLKGVFNLQYRMHPDINEVIKQFYIDDGGLECGLDDSEVNDPDLSNPVSRFHGIEINDIVTSNNHVIWIDTDSPELLDGTSRINYGEVEAINDVLTKFQESSSFHKYQSFWKDPEDQQIGLISFYGKQIRLLRNLRNKFKDIPIRVSTVDRFQGMERNIIIVSMVRSNRLATHTKQKSDINLYPKLGFPEQKSLGFAQSPNRLNVALSRAKRLLIIVGNSELFRQKDIYNNVYKIIETNPNSRIIKYSSFNYTEELTTPFTSITPRSLNLNTQDISENDTYLRNVETWFTENKIQPKIAVLELSTKAVKMLFADQTNLTTNGFDFKWFIRDTQKTETGNGLDSNNNMNMNYFNQRVLPAIDKRVKIIRENKVDVLYCVATAAYRTAINRDEIIKSIKDNIGINVKILSKEEEAEATLLAYTFSTKHKEIFLQSKNIIVIDQGGGSTEISIFKDQDFVKSHSFEIGTTALKNLLFRLNKTLSVEEALSTIDKKSTEKIKKDLSGFKVEFDGTDIYCVSVGTAITEATPGRKSKDKHDKILSRERISNSIESYTDKLKSNFSNIGNLEREILMNKDSERILASRLGLPVFLEIMKHFGINALNVSGTGLWYGIFFKEFYLKQNQ